jgi:hypothetical protein
MKIHGYADEGLEVEAIVPAELAEITLVASPDELRRIARFLENCVNFISSAYLPPFLHSPSPRKQG